MKMSSRRQIVLCGVWSAAVLVVAGALTYCRAEDPAVGPRLGRYTVTFFMGALRSPSFFAYLDLLPGNKYRVLDFGEKPLGEGTYALDDKGNVKWLTGKYKDEGYGGSFQIDGTRHQIHMKDRLYARNQPADK
jgi:hypothetical protein